MRIVASIFTILFHFFHNCQCLWLVGWMSQKLILKNFHWRKKKDLYGESFFCISLNIDFYQPKTAKNTVKYLWRKNSLICHTTVLMINVFIYTLYPHTLYNLPSSCRCFEMKNLTLVRPYIITTLYSYAGPTRVCSVISGAPVLSWPPHSQGETQGGGNTVWYYCPAAEISSC